MSTRGIYTFEDATDMVHVYKHWDNYPTGAAEFIEKALALAWPLPRFEPTEFAAAFVAANKTQAGNIRLLPYGVKPRDFAPDAAFHYVIKQTEKNKVLMVHAYKVVWWTTPTRSPVSEHILSCSQKAFARKAEALELAGA
jgi:hypothetical protein